MNINKLLKPHNIALIGASEGESFGGACARNLMNCSFNKEQIFFVSVKNNMVYGKECYASIEDIPCDIDLLVIATNKNTVLGILQEGKKKNVGAAVVYASGFSETGTEEGILLEKEIIDYAKNNDIALMGPNCAGFVNFIDDMSNFAFLYEKRDRKGCIGMISQSGQIALSMIDNQNSYLSYCISAGNASVINMIDYFDFLINDQDTKVIMLYIEGIKNINLFEDKLKEAKNKNKKIVLLKMGRSNEAINIMKNHTGSMESFTNEEFDNMIKKHGVYRVSDIEELIYTAIILSKYDLSKVNNKKLASINLSGGEAAITAEVATEFNMTFSDFDSSTIVKIKKILPSYANVSNPLDTTVSISYDADTFEKLLDILYDDKNVGIIMIGYTLLLNIDDPCICYMSEAINNFYKRRGVGKPIFIMSFMSNTRNQKYMKNLLDIGIVVLPSPYYAFKIIKNVFNM